MSKYCILFASFLQNSLSREYAKFRKKKFAKYEKKIRKISYFSRKFSFAGNLNLDALDMAVFCHVIYILDCETNADCHLNKACEDSQCIEPTCESCNEGEFCQTINHQPTCRGEYITLNHVNIYNCCIMAM